MTAAPPLHRKSIDLTDTNHTASFVKKASVLEGQFRGTGTVFDGRNEIAVEEEWSLTVTRRNPRMVVYRLFNTRYAEDGAPMHLEMGVLKVLDSDGDRLPAEAGFTCPVHGGHDSNPEQLAKGSFDVAAGELTLESKRFQKTSEAGEIEDTTLRRVYRLVDSNRLVYDQFLGDVHHLHSELELHEE